MGQAAGSREPGAPDGQSRRIAAQRRGILPPYGRVLSVVCSEKVPGEPPKINQSITLTKRFVIHAFIIMQPRAVWLDSGTVVVPGSHLPL